jgi:acyl-CoA reductase-like NAD-dependent aldehyde dehydrogenase
MGHIVPTGVMAAIASNRPQLLEITARQIEAGQLTVTAEQMAGILRCFKELLEIRQEQVQRIATLEQRTREIENIAKALAGITDKLRELVG